jgi:phage/conjugal plasmid C-4 type zinc finger TraR family protein
MTDFYDRSSAREEELRQDALTEQAIRAALSGKTVDDSAVLCQVCSYKIPQARRVAVPGVQTCVPCQEDLERGLK